MIQRIAIVGTESTGKSELASSLAKHFKTTWVDEYARIYLQELGRNYEYDDLIKIAKMQVHKEDEAARFSDKILFCDTNLTVIKIWSEFKYDKCDEWILNEIKSRKYFLHLLTDIDIPWQPDPLREHPNKRIELFRMYADELKKQNASFEIVSGSGKYRLLNAIKIVEKKLLPGSALKDF